MAPRKSTSKKTARPKTARKKTKTAKTARAKTTERTTARTRTTARKVTPRKSARKKSTAKKTSPRKTSRKRGAPRTTRARAGWKQPPKRVAAVPTQERAGETGSRSAAESDLTGRGPSWWSKSLDATAPSTRVAPEFRRESEDHDPATSPSPTPIPIGILAPPTQVPSSETAGEDTDAIETEAPDDAATALDDAAPALDDAPPAPDDAAPTLDDAAPAPDDAAPAPDDAVPAPDDAVPAPDDAVPAPDDAVPALDDAAPALDDAAPALDDAAAASDTPPPDVQQVEPPPVQPALMIDEVKLRPRLVPSVVLPQDTPAPELSEPGEPEPDPEPDAGPSTPPADIASLDTALAADVDDLLRGDCETLDDLLDSTFDEPISEVTEPVAAGDEQSSDSEVAVSDPAAAVVKPQDFLDGIAADGEEPAAVEQPLSTPADLSEPVSVTAPSDEQDAPEESEPSEGADSPQSSKRSEPVKKLERGGPPLIITVLQRLNYPMRLLPSSTRVIVDWVAWSLIFWVPVVWVIAILVVGR